LAQAIPVPLTFNIDSNIGYSDIPNSTLYVPTGSRICLNWDVANAVDGCVASANPPSSFWIGTRLVTTNGSVPMCSTDAPNSNVSPVLTPSNTTYTLTCSNPDGNSSLNYNVVVTAPKVVIKVDGVDVGAKYKVPLGSKAKLTWEIYFANTVPNTICTRTGGDTRWPGGIPVSTTDSVIRGSFETSSLLKNTTYTISCSNGVGTDSLQLLPRKSGFKEI
jgi:hypothetical protein